MNKTLAVLLPLAVAACQPPPTPSGEPPSTHPNPPKTHASGSLAVSKDDALVYAADTDQGVLGVFDAKTRQLVRTVKVGDGPFRVAVADDDTVFVANRRSRTVSVIRRGEALVSAELATDPDPVALGIAGDGTVYVVCAMAPDTSAYGTLTAFDGRTLDKKWSLPVGEEPRGLALIWGNRAVVSLQRQGEVVVVNLGERSIQGTSATYAALNRGIKTGDTFHPRAMTDLVEAPEGRVFALGALARDGAIDTPPSTARPYYMQQGPGQVGSVTTPAVLTVDVGPSIVPKVADLASPGLTSYDARPPTSLAGSRLQGLTAGVLDPNGRWLWVLAREGQSLGRVSTTYASGFVTETQTGAGADGLAVLADGTAVFVYNQFDHTLQTFRVDKYTEKPTAVGSPVALGIDVLGPNQAAGRRLFYDANDRRISSAPAAIACSTCHVDGRDDGHTWQFPDGPRQTPTLAGRGIAETAPFHWSGEFPKMDDFLTHTLTKRMGGTGLSPNEAGLLNEYIATLPAPENPYPKEQPAGRLVFEKAGCAGCHTGPWLTNGAVVRVGTSLEPLNVPSLKGLARSAPYLHDGSVLSLEERVLKNPDDQHGVTSTLTDREKADLVAYLRTL